MRPGIILFTFSGFSVRYSIQEIKLKFKTHKIVSPFSLLSSRARNDVGKLDNKIFDFFVPLCSFFIFIPQVMVVALTLSVRNITIFNFINDKTFQTKHPGLSID